MVKKSKGLNFRTRRIFSKPPRDRGTPSLTCLLIDLPIGSKVNVIVEPSIQKGRPHRRFHGKTGSVIEKRGRSYYVQVTDGNRQKRITVRPEHLKLQT